MSTNLSQRIKEFSTALDAFTKTISEPDRNAVTIRMQTEWRHIRMFSITALLHGDFYLASRLYAACHAATRISVIIDEFVTEGDPDAAGAAQQAQAAAGSLIKEFEAMADILQHASATGQADQKPELPQND